MGILSASSAICAAGQSGRIRNGDRALEHWWLQWYRVSRSSRSWKRYWMSLADANANCNVDSYGHLDSLAYTDSNRDIYPYTYCYSHSHSDANSDGHVYADADPNTDLRYLYH